MNEGVQKVVLEQKPNKRNHYFSHPFSRKMSFFDFLHQTHEYMKD